MVRAFEKGDERKLNKEVRRVGRCAAPGCALTCTTRLAAPLPTTTQEFGRLHAFLTGVQASFSYFDKDRTNSLGQDEVAAALKQTGPRHGGLRAQQACVLHVTPHGCSVY